MVKNDLKVVTDVMELSAVLTGTTTDEMKNGGRERAIVLARIVSANFLMHELKYDYIELSNFINRDRTTFYYYFNKHNHNYKYWAEYIETYNFLKSAYLGLNNLAMSSEDMQKIFLENGIVSEPDSSFMIGFKIGNIEEFIYTKELENTIKLLRNAFKSFKYSFSVEHINSIAYES
tara:strand:- start:1129 stop:1656 length:528 start_codon:yes stop_codon:yes gene_type:complete